MQSEYSELRECAQLDVSAPARQPVTWHCHTRVDKYHGDHTAEEIAAQGLAPYESVEVEGNLLMTAGAGALWANLTGVSAVQIFDATHAYIGVGDSSTAESAVQTDLQASSNKTRKVQAATYPQCSTNQAVFQAAFGSTDANYAWNEWGLFNASVAGTMLNRKVASLGTKSAGSTWTLTVTLSLS